jgi:peptidoglycan hydrolase-like protein with peptidoglycan-binding domain
MKNFRYFITALFGLALLSAPLAFASASSVSIQSLSPGNTVSANSRITFSVISSGFFAQSYALTDSFSTSSASNGNFDPVGNFFWVPVPSDVGTHTLTITASDFSGDAASTTQSIIVAPVPSLSVQSVSPGTTIMPGTKFSFSVSASGFVSPSYIASDSFSGSSVGDPNVDTSGNFSWTPDVSQNGQHVITIYANDSLGHSATVNETVQVGTGPTLSVPSISQSTSVSPGQAVSFTVSALHFLPTAFSLTDNFSGVSTIANADINTSGAFSWTPQASDVGTHVVTVTGTIGAFGESATTSVKVIVLGPGGSLPPPSTPPPTSATSSTSLSALQAQIAQIKAQITAQSGATSTGSSSAGFTFSVYLSPGSQGEGVTQLQTLLSKQGFFSGAPSGYYGPLTTAAVKKFQAAHGLDQLGVVGPLTRAALNASFSGSQTQTATSTPASSGDGYVFNNFIGLGQNGTDVLELQKRLTALGFFTGQATGYFGSVTEEAVKQFQTAHGIRAAGYVGPGTRAALNQ